MRVASREPCGEEAEPAMQRSGSREFACVVAPLDVISGGAARFSFLISLLAFHHFDVRQIGSRCTPSSPPRSLGEETRSRLKTDDDHLNGSRYVCSTIARLSLSSGAEQRRIANEICIQIGVAREMNRVAGRPEGIWPLRPNWNGRRLSFSASTVQYVTKSNGSRDNARFGNYQVTR